MTKEKMIESFNYILGQLENGYVDLGDHDQDELESITRAINKQVPRKPIHIHEIYPKHDWIRDDDGEIDMWALDVGFHNGPMCKRCHSSVCEHCNPDWDEEECEVDEMRCPNCNEEISWPYKKNKFCRNCGQALDWSE